MMFGKYDSEFRFKLYRMEDSNSHSILNHDYYQKLA